MGLRITLDGRLLYTIEQAAEKHGLAPSSMRAVISREHLQPDAEIGRKNLYYATSISAMIKARPGKGRTKKVEK